MSTSFLEATLLAFRAQKKAADAAVAQIEEKQIFAKITEESNSIADLMKHVGGNLHSRWTDFLTTDGEKPDRDRDAEFEAEEDSFDLVRERWERGWLTYDKSFSSLKESDLTKTITIRGEVIDVPVAIQRSLAHTAQHAGQIVLLAKALKGAGWATLSMPRRKK
jgi:uncharacterized damage-inducible protein DinB